MTQRKGRNIIGIPSSACAADKVEVVSWEKRVVRALRPLNTVHNLLQYQEFRYTSNTTAICLGR